MNTPNTAVRRTTKPLQAVIAGRVFVPGEAGYDQARQAWNLAVDERPAVIVAAYPAPRPRTARSGGPPGQEPRGRPRIGPVSSAYYLGTPARVWVAAMSRRNSRDRHRR
jgi:hypothetical protein